MVRTTKVYKTPLVSNWLCYRCWRERKSGLRWYSGQNVYFLNSKSLRFNRTRHNFQNLWGSNLLVYKTNRTLSGPNTINWVTLILLTRESESFLRLIPTIWHISGVTVPDRLFIYTADSLLVSWRGEPSGWAFTQTREIFNTIEKLGYLMGF